MSLAPKLISSDNALQRNGQRLASCNGKFMKHIKLQCYFAKHVLMQHPSADPSGENPSIRGGI
ncbi:hypothetical protein A9Q83_09705 [Alphaproteobacteria bacterium 46_93_T64]|nr:hypothetical protein A9Q83_09705 [Alphaproteobacteria bacterium 46_93_T64]